MCVSATYVNAFNMHTKWMQQPMCVLIFNSVFLVSVPFLHHNLGKSKKKIISPLWFVHRFDVALVTLHKQCRPFRIVVWYVPSIYILLFDLHLFREIVALSFVFIFYFCLLPRCIQQCCKRCTFQFNFDSLAVLVFVVDDCCCYFYWNRNSLCCGFAQTKS